MVDVLFKKVDYTLKGLIENIHLGDIGLPDIQRPFVWPRSKVRDLFDSMYRGFPIGYLLFWENGNVGSNYRSIGMGEKQKVPKLLIVDGQQRLTSLYAVVKGVKVLDKDYHSELIRIAFHPSDERFEVWNSAIEKDPEWIPDISVLWKPETSTYTFIQDFLNQLKERGKLSADKEKKIPAAIERLVKLQDYPITALEVSYTVDEDRVAEIFVRINSKGKPLNQADFILTLMSVFWDEGRKQLEEFCHKAKNPPIGQASPYNHYLLPNPDQLLRTSIAFGFRRARLEHVYSLLRGKDLQTKQFSEEQREKQFSVLKESQAYVLDLQNWHDFFKVLKRAGYTSSQFISSQIAVLYTYALWLIGKRDFKVDDFKLREIMARWFFMVTLTGRYSSSPESRMEQDLALLREAQTADDFIEILNQQIDAVLTRDYWEVTLPNELETATARNTGQFAYFAALCLLDAPVLYSNMKVSDLLDPTTKAKKASLERHHLFPRGYLKSINIDDIRLLNQVANFALVEWRDNIKISDQPPYEYVPELERRFASKGDTASDLLREMYRLHALPERWYEMEYQQFLIERRKRMAEIIRQGFNKISGK